VHSLFYYRYDKRRNPKTKQYCKYLRHQQECIIRQPLVLLSVMAIFFDTIAIDMNSIVDCQSARYIVRMIIWMEHGVMMWNVEICNRCIYRYISRLVCRLCTVQYCPVKVSDDSLIQIYWTPTWICRRTTGHFVQIFRLMLGSLRTPQRTIYM